jgi:hypothetical protein
VHVWYLVTVVDEYKTPTILSHGPSKPHHAAKCFHGTNTQMH